MADRLILTKIDLAEGAASLPALRTRLVAINPGARQIMAIRGEVAGSEIVDIGLLDQRAARLDPARWLCLPVARDGLFRHEAAIASHALVFARPTSWAGLAAWSDLIRARHADRLLRVKGIVWIDGADAPVVIHGVHRIFDAPLRLEATLPDRLSRLVVIARDLDFAALRDTLPALWPDRDPEAALAEAGIDRAAA
jgi:G3E family GTPase